MEGDKLPLIFGIVIGSSLLISLLEWLGVRKKHHH
jgi:hypothetical protein